MPEDDEDKINRLVFQSMLLFIWLKLSFGYMNYFISLKHCRWPVPKPHWCRPEEVESDDDDKLAFDDFGRLQYSYFMGRKVKLLVQTHSSATS